MANQNASAEAHYAEFKEHLDALAARKARLAPVPVGIPSDCNCKENGDKSKCKLHSADDKYDEVQA